MCVCVCANTSVLIHECMYVCVYVCMDLCAGTCARARVCVCVHAWMHV